MVDKAQNLVSVYLKMTIESNTSISNVPLSLMVALSDFIVSSKLIS